MHQSLANQVLPQLDSLLQRFQDLKTRALYDDFSDLDNSELIDFVTAGIAAIYRIAGSSSVYARETERNIEDIHWSASGLKVPRVAGALKALRQDIADGYLDRVEELVHASVFADFLEMADHLLNEGYKDPSAVLVGGVLEEHLRKLCLKNAITLDFADTKGNMRPKKADTLNGDLGSAGVYTKLDQKQITGWLDLRNKAAHGQYSLYTQQQVELVLQAVQEFMIRNPA